jgi:hypothetical protein
MPKKDIEEDKVSPRRSARLKAMNAEEKKKSKRGKSKNTSPTKKEEEKEVKVSPAPKKVNSSYFWFCNANRKKVMDANKGKNVGAITEILKTMWDGLDDKEKIEYNEMEDKDKAR